MKKVKHCLVRDSKWKVLWRNLSQDPIPKADQAMGWCYKEQKIIELDPNLTEGLTTEIALHEFLHAFFPDLSEETVTLFAEQAASFLAAMNLIRYEDEEDELQ